jgi:hypothetical protein
MVQCNSLHKSTSEMMATTTTEMAAAKTEESKIFMIEKSSLTSTTGRTDTRSEAMESTILLTERPETMEMNPRVMDERTTEP